MQLNTSEDEVICGIVYLATNKTNSKQYVGITTRSLRDRRTGHVTSANSGYGNDTSIQAAIRKDTIDATVIVAKIVIFMI